MSVNGNGNSARSWNTVTRTLNTRTRIHTNAIGLSRANSASTSTSGNSIESENARWTDMSHATDHSVSTNANAIDQLVLTNANANEIANGRACLGSRRHRGAQGRIGATTDAQWLVL